MNENIFIAKSADIVGKVQLEKEVSIWFQAVLRGDYESISIGKSSNIQDGTIVHVDHQAPVEIGEYVTVGHNCIIHGCKIDDNVLIGMGSIILNNAKIGKNTIIGAGSLVTQNVEIPENSLVLGSPAKVIRKLTNLEVASIKENALNYVKNAKNYDGKSFAVSENGWILAE